MDALCNPLTGECSVSYEVPSDEKPQLEDKIVLSLMHGIPCEQRKGGYSSLEDPQL